MNTQTKITTVVSKANSAETLVKTLDWEQISRDLDAQGSAILERIISPDECQALAELYHHGATWLWTWRVQIVAKNLDNDDIA